MTESAAQIGLGADEPSPSLPPSNELLRAVRIAEKCFEIARSSAHRGEREAAASRGMAVAKKAGLRLDLFDVPGRDGYRLKSALRDIDETRRRWASALQAADDETIYGAKRRAFDAATHAADERDRSNGRRTGAPLDVECFRQADLRNRWPSTDAALNALRARRIEVFPIDFPAGIMWSAPTLARPALDEWQLRELADEVCA